MVITYRDIISGDALLSNEYTIKEASPFRWEVDCQLTRADQVIDVINQFKLQKTSFDKKSYVVHLRAYSQELKEKLKEAGTLSEDMIKAWKAAEAADARSVVAKFHDWDFYVGENSGSDGMVVLLNYRADGITPYLSFWRYDLTAEDDSAVKAKL